MTTKPIRIPAFITEVENKLQNHSLNIYLNKDTAAWTHDGQVNLCLGTVNKAVNFWGSSFNKNAQYVKLNKQVRVIVACHELTRVIKQYDVDDINLVKMNIEEVRSIDRSVSQRRA